MTNIEIKNFKPSFDFPIEIQEFNKDSFLVSFENTSRYFKISPKVAFILNLIDGETTVESITEKYNAQYDAELVEADIYTLITEKLEKTFNVASVDKNDAPSYLKMSTIILNKKYVHAISSLFYKLYNPRIALFGSILSVALIFYCVFSNLNSIQTSLSYYPPSYIAYFVLIMILSTIFHEIGHASACRAYGAEHGGIGVGFYLITPVMFADVTSAWQLPAKQRVVINLGGIYFELLFSIIILCLYLVTGNIFYVNATIIIFLKLLYNLNPFFRTDGYWVISDYFNFPNLRRQSNLKVKKLYNSIINLDRLRLSGRDWFLVFYGGFSLGVLVLFFYYVIFYNIQSLIYLPLNLYTFFEDLITKNSPNIMDMLNGLNTILIPMFFYYLFFKTIIIPLYRRIYKKYFLLEEPSV